MVNAFITAYLLAPLLFGLAVAIYGFTRGNDRIHLASVYLVLCCFLYSGVSYALLARDASNMLAYGLGSYALIIYVAVAGLAIYMHRLAWRVAVAAFLLHLVATLASLPAILSSGHMALLALFASAVVAAAGLWASLHRGTRAAISAAHISEA